MSAVDKGSDINYTWTTDGATYDVKNPKVLYNNTGKATNAFDFFTEANLHYQLSLSN